MYKFLTKNGQSLALALGVLVVAFFLGSVFSGFDSMGYDMSTDLNKLTDEQQSEIGFFDGTIKVTVFMIGAAFILAFLVFGVFDLIKFPKNAIKFIIGLLVIGGVFFALYSSSSFDQMGRLAMLNEKFDITEGISKFISGGIKTTLGLLAVAGLAILADLVMSIVK